MTGYNAGCEGWFVEYMFGLKEDRSEGWIGKMHSVGDGRGKEAKGTGLLDMISDSYITDPRNILCKGCVWAIPP